MAKYIPMDLNSICAHRSIRWATCKKKKNKDKLKENKYQGKWYSNMWSLKFIKGTKGKMFETITFSTSIGKLSTWWIFFTLNHEGQRMW